LPPGLSLDLATGVISGVPPHGAEGTYGFIVTVTDMHGNTASNSFSISVKAFYTANVTISMSLLQPCQATVYLDGKPSGVLKGGESLTLSFYFGTTHAVSVDPLITDPGNKDRRFKAVDVALTVTEASPNVVFRYTTEYSVGYETEPRDINGLPSPDWYPEDSMLTASAAAVVDGPPGTQYHFAHWRLPTGETIASPQLRVTVKWGGEIVAAYDTYYLLTVVSEYGTAQGAGYYKASTSAPWSVTPAEVKMSGVLGFLGGKLKPKNAEGTEIMASPKTVTILWQSDYKMPILIGALVLLFVGLGSFLGYRHYLTGQAKPEEAKCGLSCSRCQKGSCTLPRDHEGACNSEHDQCDAKNICTKCNQPISQCSLCKGTHGDAHKFPLSQHTQCGAKKMCPKGNCQFMIQCSLCKETHGKDHNFPAHKCTHGKYKCKCGADLVCTADCHADHPNQHSSEGHVCPYSK